MRIIEHAVDRYIENVLEKDVEDVTQDRREEVKDRIKQAVNEPTVIYHGEKDKAPVHILGGAAVIVDPDGDGTGEVTVPTVYKSTVFIDKINEQGPA